MKTTTTVKMVGHNAIIGLLVFILVIIISLFAFVIYDRYNPYMTNVLQKLLYKHRRPFLKELMMFIIFVLKIIKMINFYVMVPIMCYPYQI